MATVGTGLVTGASSGIGMELARLHADEAETFQSVLTAVRTELANQYLSGSRFSLGEISFLLGFREQNSFNRACREWTGMTPGQFRSKIH